MKYSYLILLLLPFSLIGQASFYANNTALGGIDIHSTVPIGIADLNGDFLDDIICLDKGKALHVFIQHSNTHKFTHRFLGQVSFSGQWALNVCDLDNDGVKEILVAGIYDGMKVYKAFDDQFTYLKAYETEKDFYTQNISAHDINNDGFIDVLINDDDAEPKVYLNDQNGILKKNTSIIDFNTSIPSDNSGNYGCIWSDVDGDGDSDLYISKCKIGVVDPADPRRINQLFINENGTFTESASLYGLDIGAQSWVSSFADLDNDNDLDLVVLNHTEGNMIFRNEGPNTYTKMEVGPDFLNVSAGTQLVTKDFDNDGNIDILISGEQTAFFYNSGNMEFETKFLTGSKSFTSFAIGDLNNDGFWDIYASSGIGLIQPNPFVDDQIWWNEAKDNHYIKMSIVNNEGAYDAESADISFYSSKGIQRQEKRIGDGYGTTNSGAIVFGLGVDTDYDSLLITWPDGLRTSYNDFTIDEHHIISNPHCNSLQKEIIFSGNEVLCDNDTIILDAGVGTSYEWNTGEKTRSIEVSQEGTYGVIIVDDNGCSLQSSTVRIELSENKEAPTIEILEPKAAYCRNENIALSANIIGDLLWSNGATSSSIISQVEEHFTVTNLACGELSSDTLFVNVLKVNAPEVQDVTVQQFSDAIVTAIGDSVHWYKEETSVVPIFIGEEYLISEVSSDLEFYVENLTQFRNEDEVLHLELNDQNQYNPDQINGGIIFSVNEYTTELASVYCYSEIAGSRNIQILDVYGNVLFEKMVYIDSTTSKVDLGFTLFPSNYYFITTDPVVNTQNFGTTSPQLKRSNFEKTPFPLSSTKKNLSLIGGSGTPTAYYYFYGFEMVDYDVICRSDRVRVEVFADVGSGVSQDLLNQVMIYPNPATDLLMIEKSTAAGLQYKICDLQGRKVLEGNCSANCSIDLKTIADGYYYIQLTTEFGSLSKKLLKL